MKQHNSKQIPRFARNDDSFRVGDGFCGGGFAAATKSPFLCDALSSRRSEATEGSAGTGGKAAAYHSPLVRASARTNDDPARAAIKPARADARASTVLTVKLLTTNH